MATRVNASLEIVKQGFTKELFLSLNPPFPPVKLLRFDGCGKGDYVSLELNFLFFKQEWVSEIVDHGFDGARWYFIDEGKKLPFFLKRWRHVHTVEAQGKGSCIIDAITFSTGSGLTDSFFYPLLLGQFLYRKPVYKKVFK